MLRVIVRAKIKTPPKARVVITTPSTKVPWSSAMIKNVINPTVMIIVVATKIIEAVSIANGTGQKIKHKFNVEGLENTHK
jgi:hypothetical protein